MILLHIKSIKYCTNCTTHYNIIYPYFVHSRSEAKRIEVKRSESNRIEAELFVPKQRTDVGNLERKIRETVVEHLTGRSRTCE